MTPRRRFLKYIAGAAGVSAAAAAAYLARGGLPRSNDTTVTSSSSTGSVSANIPPDYAEFLTWLGSASKPFRGQQISISLEDEIVPRAIQNRDSDFFNTTQINANYSLKPYFLHLADISIMVRTNASSYDVFSIDYQDLGFYKDSIISPTELSEMYPDLTYAPIRAEDFQTVPWSLLATYPPAGLPSATGQSSSEVLFVPIDMPIMVQLYRTDIYNSANVNVAATWDELFDDAQKFTGTSHYTPYGIVNESSGTIAVVYEYLNHLASFGGSLWDIQGDELVSALGSDQALAALENYVRFAKYADPASSTYSWDEVATDMETSIAASALLWYDYAYLLNDPVRSYVPGKIGYSSNPAGPSGSFSTYGGNGVGVSRKAKNPQVAWLWLQWATSLGLQEMTVLDAFHVLPTRTAALNASVVKDATTGPEYEAFQAARGIWQSNGVTSLTPFPQWQNVLAILGPHLSSAYTGGEQPSNALAASVQEIEALGKLTL